ncbi:unnamed protein product, partial [Iphiclides podalirius]
MSTRWYPIYQRGNPQLRVFLPNFWMKLVRPPSTQLPNVVNFKCSMEMTKYDIRNYLEKIYNVPVVDVRTKIRLGRFRKDVGKGYIVKDDDVKFAYVVLPKEMTFKFPDLFDGPTRRKPAELVDCMLIASDEDHLQKADRCPDECGRSEFSRGRFVLNSATCHAMFRTKEQRACTMKGFIHLLVLIFCFTVFFGGIQATPVPEHADNRITSNLQPLKRLARQLPSPPQVPPFDLPPGMKGYVENARNRREAKGSGGYMPNRKG